ncbi:MAG: hypothetical protein ABI778_01505 [Ignavibacteriota bacterium]
MINTEEYQTKEFTTNEFTPARSIHASRPETRMRKPRSYKTYDVPLNSGDLDFLSDFVKVTAFYIEDLEDYLGEEIMDFWQSREHALKIITEAMMARMESTT